MPFSPFRRNRASRTIALLYGAIVAQARQPVFYRNYGVRDSVDGRLDLVILHAILALRRLEQADMASQGLGEGLFAEFCGDMDGNLREMGVGDLAVPKRMRRIGEAFYGRRAAYDAALAQEGDVELAAALGRNVFGGARGRAAEAAALALYVRGAEAALRAQPVGALGQGTIAFPDPGTFLGDPVPHSRAE